MTVAIAVCLSDGVLLIADDCRSNPFVTAAPPQDRIDKIHRIGERTALISFGIEQPTSEAMTRMRSSVFDGASTVLEIARYVERVGELAWALLLISLATDVDRQDPAMKSGFLFGGYIPVSDNFVGGVLFRIDGHDPPTLETEYGKFIVLGGEEQNAEGLFKETASRNLASVRSQGTGILDNHVMAFLSAGIATIRQVAGTNSSVGRNARYAVIRRGYQYHEEWFE